MKQQFKIIQNQKQKFSSKLVPSIEILKLSQQELETLVDTSLLDNPFSDVEDNEFSVESNDVDLDFKKVQKRNDDIQEFDFADENQNDLIDYVMPQLLPYIKTKKDEEVFKFLMASLDPRGFLLETEKDLCNYLNISRNKLQHYLYVMQHVDPKGLATSGYCECILVQLSQLENSMLAQRIVQSYLEEIGTGNYAKIAKLENTSIDDVRAALLMIQSQNPIPANGFKVKTKTMYIVPDVYVRTEGNEITIDMNAGIQDKLKMNVSNYELYKSSLFDEESKVFLKKKLNDFKWLQYSVSRRSATIKKIFSFLVEYQVKFFQTGDERNLRPLRLVDIARGLDIHYSTVSRAIANKFFQCEYGTYSFHFLIPKCYEKQGEVNVSIDTIKNEIKEIIKYEDKQSPFSDEQIHKLLEEEGFVVSRRSVALYRKECGIPSSRNRKII